jgi:hypothetical protein
MKKTIRITQNDPVRYFFSEIGFPEKKAVRLASLLKGYNIHIVAQLMGAFCPPIPKLSQKEWKKRGIACASATLIQHRKPVQIVARLQRVLKISKKEAAVIYNAFHKIPKNNQSYYFNFRWSLGGRKKTTQKQLHEFWQTAPGIHIAPGFFVIPDYETAGSIFDQGERGTCVANAFGTLLNYKSNRQISRQFLYHQCKMIDGIPNEEGTYMEMPSKVLNRFFSDDFGCVSEDVWSYNPLLDNSQHQGPPPEKSFSCNRVLLGGNVIEPRRENRVQDIKYLLNYGQREKTCPVTIGLELYPSFFSKSTTETGWVTMPLPGEPVMGYHAMIIVGYDEKRKLFLVRNSWGTAWAAGNDKGFKGHAWVPYEYVEKYGFGAQTIKSVQFEPVTVFPEDRLYNNMKNAARRKIAALKTQRRAGYYPGRRVGFFGWLIRAAVIILLWKAYHEPITKMAHQTLELVQSHIDLETLPQKTKDFIEENFLSINNKTTKP